MSKNGNNYYVKKADGKWYQVSRIYYKNSQGTGTDDSTNSTYTQRIYDDSTVVHSIPFSRTYSILYGASAKDIFPLEGCEGRTWTANTYFSQRLAAFEKRMK